MSQHSISCIGIHEISFYTLAPIKKSKTALEGEGVYYIPAEIRRLTVKPALKTLILSSECVLVTDKTVHKPGLVRQFYPG